MLAANSMDPVNGMALSTLAFPFLVVEFKASTRNMTVAANQCKGGSATCVHVVKGLNNLATGHGIDTVDTTAFSVAMNGHWAVIYAAWDEGRNFYVQRVKDYLLHLPEHFLKFSNVVRNMLEWGKDRRLQAIRECLDSIYEAQQKLAEQSAKARRDENGDSSQDDNSEQQDHPRKKR
ncbi:hypothetical protein BJ170DRAFT_634816 [Xylariales sp. AK1849]|nr:hypothetical protein BJ170DRAFT_634816 [Xylariales sp. AK1849]